MKKKTIIGILVVLILILAGLVAWWTFLKKPEPDPVQWGMTKAQIKEYEAALSGTLKAESGSTLLYQSRLFKRFPMAVEYEFQSGKLTRRKYMSVEKDVSSDDSIRDVQGIRKQLILRYGKPEIANKDQVQIEAWTTQDTMITLRLWKTNPWTLEYRRN